MEKEGEKKKKKTGRVEGLEEKSDLGIPQLLGNLAVLGISGHIGGPSVPKFAY